VVEFFQKNALLPAGLEFLGYLWIPALLLGYYFVYRNPPKNARQLFQSSVFLLLVFFLSRTWLSEPNINLLLPLFLLLLGYGKIGMKTFHLGWIIPFAFVFLNYAFPQLFFLVYPQIMGSIAEFDVQFGTVRLIGRFIVTILWYIIAVKILSACLKKDG
jgi:hypothetical protein